MTERKVTTIPATLARFTAVPIAENRKRRTAAYARVSTDTEEQLSSYEAQVRFYTDYIQSRSDWEFAGVYTDEGITGTSTEHREGFKRMMKDALSGKIDLIVTKSVSRFARNTVDSLTAVRDLKAKGVEIYFEKENIWTLDSKGELLITIMSSLAQEEARSISENVTWGIRKRFADGKVSMPYSSFLGYEKGPDGTPVINEKEAGIVRMIYSLFLQGNAISLIASYLTKNGIPTPRKKTKWTTTTVESILTNEKYKGDAILQKTYISDFLTKKAKPNNGEIPKYYVENSHPAIISAETFALVQDEMRKRREDRTRTTSVSVFSGRVYCGKCGSVYGRKVWHSTDRYRREIWRCDCKYEKKGHVCDSPHFTEEQLEKAAMNAINDILKDKEVIINETETVLVSLFDTSSLVERRNNIEARIVEISNKAKELIGKNSRITQDQKEYQKEYSKLSDEYHKLKKELDETEAIIADKETRKIRADEFLDVLKKSEVITGSFTPEFFIGLVEKMTVLSKDEIRVEFRNGNTITTKC